MAIAQKNNLRSHRLLHRLGFRSGREIVLPGTTESLALYELETRAGSPTRPDAD